MVFGMPSVFKLKGTHSHLVIMTEEEAAGIRASEMVKLEAAMAAQSQSTNNEDHSDFEDDALVADNQKVKPGLSGSAVSRTGKGHNDDDDIKVKTEHRNSLLMHDDEEEDDSETETRKSRSSTIEM